MPEFTPDFPDEAPNPSHPATQDRAPGTRWIPGSIAPNRARLAPGRDGYPDPSHRPANTVRDLCGVSAQAANTAVRRLADLGILRVADGFGQHDPACLIDNGFHGITVLPRSQNRSAWRGRC